MYRGILLSHKKEQSNAICSNMDGPRDHHTKSNKSDREIQISYDLTYMWNLQYFKMNLFIKQKQPHRHSKKIKVTKRGKRKRKGGIN